MLDRVLQAGSCHGEVNGILIGVVLRKSVNECAAEGVTAANTVNDLDTPLRALEVSSLIPGIFLYIPVP